MATPHSDSDGATNQVARRGWHGRPSAVVALVGSAWRRPRYARSATWPRPHRPAPRPRSPTCNIILTPQGCVPQPAKVTTGHIQFNVSNKNAGAVSEAELRTSNLSQSLGEQENLTPGLSGGFELIVQPGDYVINCPGASQPTPPSP